MFNAFTNPFAYTRFCDKSEKGFEHQLYLKSPTFCPEQTAEKHCEHKELVEPKTSAFSDDFAKQRDRSQSVLTCSKARIFLERNAVKILDTMRWHDSEDPSRPCNGAVVPVLLEWRKRWSGIGGGVAAGNC